MTGETRPRRIIRSQGVKRPVVSQPAQRPWKDWRELHALRSKSAPQKPGPPPEDALGRPDLSDPATKWEWIRYNRWKRVKKVAKAMERLGWSDAEIQDYVRGGWESESFTLSQDRFCDLIIEIDKLARGKTTR